MKRLSHLVIMTVIASGCSGGDESVISVSSSAPVSLTSADDVKLSEALDRVIQQIEMQGDSLVVGNSSSPITSLDAAQSQIALVTEAPIAASRAYKDWYIFGTARSDDEAFKFHAGYAVRHGDTVVFRFGFW